MKIALIAIGIVIIGALFIIQDFGSQTITDPVQSQPTSQPTQKAPEPEPTQPTSQPTQTSPEPEPSQPISQPIPSWSLSNPCVCIPPYPPDLDCGEIQYSNFRVVQPDPHGFDRDQDGIGCEVGWLCTGSVIV